MPVSRLSRFIMAALLLLIVASLPGPTLAADSDPVDWSTVPPSEIHQRLWESKVSVQADREFLKRVATADPASTQTNYDVLFYDVFIRINDTTEVVYGDIRFVAEAVASNVSAVEVDFFANMSIDSIVAPYGPLAYSRSGDVVTVQLDSTFRAGEQIDFDFYYYGHPEEGGFQAFSFGAAYGRPVISTLSEPYFARSWWPCKDRMDDKADSFDIAVEVDTSFYVGSNGTLDSTIDNGGNTQTFHYSVRYPMATYLFSLAVSPYDVWYDEWVYNGGLDTMPIVHAVYPDLLSYSEAQFALTPNAITVFSENFGQYPYADEKYGHSLFTWSGAMEHQTMSSMAASTFGMSEPVIVHEMAHQWWGDMITCESWQDIWLNEGWASYAEALYFETIDGAAAYRSYMMGMDYTSGGTIYVQDTSQTWNIFTSRVYDKGAWVLHMLRGVVGEELFFDGIDAWYNSEFKFKAATTEDFKNVYEAATGFELDPFFDQWIHGTYRPYYQWSMMTEPAPEGGYNMYMRVKQVQTSLPQVFDMPVDFYFSGPNDTVTFQIDERSTRLKYHFPVNVSTVAMDPLNWVMKTQLKLSWTMFIVSLRDDLAQGQQYYPYVDTIDVRGGSVSRTWSITSGALPSGLTLNNQGVISGTSSDTGLFAFTVLVDDNSTSYFDSADFELYLAPVVVLPGDVNNNGEVNVSDLTSLVSFLFQTGQPPLIANTADVDGSCAINVADVTYLVAYLFSGGPAPVGGCVP